MTRKSLFTSAMVALAIAAVGGAPVARSDDDGREKGRRLQATLSGYNEVPSTLSSPARGSWRGRISGQEDEIEWRLEYRDIPTEVTQAHIHFGDHHTVGGISVFLCTNLGNGPAGTPACPNGAGTQVVTGTALAEDVIGPAGQGIAAGEFAELVRAIKAGRTYVNVHTTAFPPGEIRGQVKSGH
jgi:hypothetical protein